MKKAKNAKRVTPTKSKSKSKSKASNRTRVRKATTAMTIKAQGAKKSKKSNNRRAVVGRGSRRTSNNNSKKKKEKASARKFFYVRISGQSGQFTISKNTLNKLNKLDNSVVELLKRERESGTSDAAEYENNNKNNAKLGEIISKMTSLVKKEGKPLPHEQIVPSDLIIPDENVTFDQAKKIFEGEGGAIPENLVF